ncbi:MAG: single-stranded-DNA-specific exonuclease RecJ [Deltaproteobacteria bacterium]|nr:MAG: single-stranded-DNA-specific exonuclease RecJ [Deltaproteobacteria bacterium]
MHTEWHIHSPSPRARELASRSNLNPIIAQVLINRGITDEKSARAFISPRLSDMPDPRSLPDMVEAAELVCESIYEQDAITVYGDYDADGLTGACLLYHFFKDLGVPCHVYIPNRLTEGYGLNQEAVRKIAGTRGGLLITVDCGVSDQEQVRLASEMGMKVVITDHHKISKDPHFQCPLVNPQRPDCAYPERELAGVAVAFLLAVAVRARLREKGYFKIRPEPELKDFLDLVAIGTVADQVPLLGQSRAFVRHGLLRLRDSRWPGLIALMAAACTDPQRIGATDIAFRIAPRLNAPGRVSSPDICLRILTEEDKEIAEQLAGDINAINALRQRLEHEVLRDISELVERDEAALADNVLVFGKEGWHQGVLGIVASRLVDKYHRPALVLGFEGDTAKGSGRSFEAFNLYEALNRVSNLLERFGGHSHAAGFSLKRSRFPLLKKAICDVAEELLGPEGPISVLKVDMELHFGNISRNLVKDLKALAPFGNGNPEPIFCTRSAQILEARVVGENHLKMTLREGERIYDAIGFRMGTRLPKVGSLIDIAYTPQLNVWQGHESIQLRLADFRIRQP